MVIFSYLAPNLTYKLAQEIAAEPAPEITIFTLVISFPAISKAFNNAAEEIIAVPC